MKLLHELQRRQMFRLAGLYIFGAWAVIEVADIALPSWGFPDSAMRYLFYAALLCFPIALVFGWYFDIRSDGIYRTRKAGPDEMVDTKMRWQDYLILVALAGVGISVLLGSAERILIETDMAPVETNLFVERRQNSVAVLPFENLDPNPETGYFSDGVADEILSRLANMRTLFVVGRASSFAFRDSGESPVVVAAKLGVEYLLSGSVRRDGNTVRVTARLIDENGSHVWSQSFDRELEKTLAIQAEIAQEVAIQIVSEVSRPECAEVTETVVPEAYSDYLLGRKLFQERTHLWHEEAPKLFRKAIELDPDFAPAHAYLAISQSLWEPRGDKLEEVEAATARAMEIAPDLAETLFAKALLVKWRDKDEQASIALLRQAIECDLALSTASNYLSLEFMRIGHLAEAKDLREDALSRDPLNPVLIINVAWDYLRRGELEKGEQLMLRMTQLPERPQVFHMNMLEMYGALGRWDEYIRWSKDQVRTAVQLDWKPERREWIRDALFSVLEAHATVYVDIGLREYGLQLLSRLAEQHPSDAGRRGAQVSLCLAQGDFNCAIKLLEERRKASSDDDSAWLTPWIGMTYFAAEDYEEAIDNLEPVFAEGDLADQLESADDFELLHYLAFAHRALGRDDIARRLASEAGAILDTRIEALGPGLEATQTEIALNRWLRGDIEGAVEAFRKSVDAGWVSLYEAREDPLWREFFQVADVGDELRAVEADLARQRAVVEAADANDDFGDVVDAFLAKHSE